MIIAWQDLSQEALTGVIEEYITREGTDYGHGEWTLEDKVLAVRKQLESGEAVIIYDVEANTCTIKPRTDVDSVEM